MSAPLCLRIFEEPVQEIFNPTIKRNVAVLHYFYDNHAHLENTTFFIVM